MSQYSSGSQPPLYLQHIMRLLSALNKATVANWCLDCAAKFVLPVYEKERPGDSRPAAAIEAAYGYLADKVTLSALKHQILQSRAAAREPDSNYAAQAAAHAIAQAAAATFVPECALELLSFGSAAIVGSASGLKPSDPGFDSLAEPLCAKMEELLRKTLNDLPR